MTELYHQGEKVSRVLEKREKSLPNHPFGFAVCPYRTIIFYIYIIQYIYNAAW